MMMERIEIGYINLGLFWHSFLLYTDKNGKQSYLRAGPADKYGVGDGVFYKVDELSISRGEYIEGTVEYPPDGHPYPTEVLLQGEDLSGAWNNVNKSADKYEAGYAYIGTRQNCNTFTASLLKENDIPLPKFNTYTGYWTLGFNDDLNKIYGGLKYEYYLEIKDLLGGYIDDIKKFFGFNSINIVDPLALDLNGAYFDHNGDGVSHKSS
jgi:hypothetical protein